MSCKTHSNKVKLISSCESPVYTHICNADWVSAGNQSLSAKETTRIVIKEKTTIVGTEIIVTVRNGRADVQANDGDIIQFGDTDTAVLIYESRPDNGRVVISNLSEDADVFVQYKPQ